MIDENQTERYSAIAIVLHWLTLALLICVYAAIEFREFYPRGSDMREGLKTWHFMLGLSVFGLVWLRLVVHLLLRTPDPVERGWRYVISRVTHFALYVFMIGMPIAGWIILSAEGDVVPFFGLELPHLVGTNADLAEGVEEWHELGGTIGYWLIGLHAAAALFHHYILRDMLIARMLPRRKLRHSGN